MKKGIFHKIAITVAVIAVLGFGAYYASQTKGYIDYAEHISDVAVTVNGEPLTLQDLAFYVIYEEHQIEEQALIYNPDSTKDYWNLHIDGIFLASDAKKTALGMAVHDYIFYQKAVEENIQLTAEEEAYLNNEIQDFWMDLYDEQLENLPTEPELIEESMYKMALAQKYQLKLAEETGLTYHGYDWDGYDYTNKLEPDYKIKVNRKVWSRVRVGEVSLRHDSVSYINGLTDEERQELTDEKKKGR